MRVITASETVGIRLWMTQKSGNLQWNNKTLAQTDSQSVPRSHLTLRIGAREGERARQIGNQKDRTGKSASPQSALEGVRFGRSCQESLCQTASSSDVLLVWTNLAPLCSRSYQATSPQPCGPLPQARIKLLYRRLHSLLKNRLGVIPVWNQSSALQHILSLTMRFLTSTR